MATEIVGYSPESLVQYGYSGDLWITIADLDAKWSWRRLHPELRRRLLAMWFSHPSTEMRGVDADGLPILWSPMGHGGGARDPVQQRAEFLRRHTLIPTGRNSRTFEGKRYYLKWGYAPYAPPGSSNHEDGTLEGWAAAIDTVGWEDGWQVENAHHFALKSFVNVGNEPWHLQLAEFANSKRDLVAQFAQGRKVQRPELPTPPKAIPLPAPAPDPLPAPDPRPVKFVTIKENGMSLNFNVVPERVYDSVNAESGNLFPGETRRIPVGMTNVVAANITVAGTSTPGFVSVAGSDGAGSATSIANYDADGTSNGLYVGACPDGHIYVTASGGPCRVIVDVMLTGAA